MKKLVSVFCGVMFGILLAFGCGVVWSENVASADDVQTGNTRVVTIKKEQYEYFEIEEMSYVIDGIRVQYNKNYFVGDDENEYKYKVEYSGVSGSLGLLEGDTPQTLYYNTEPFSEILDGYGVETMVFKVDADSEFYCKLSPKDGRFYYFSGFSFTLKEGSPYKVDETEMGENGINFKGAYDETLGCFYQTINTEHTFHYDMDGDKLWFKIMGVKSDMTIEISRETKVSQTIITGNGASYIQARKYFGYTDPVEIKFTSADGYIIDKLDLFYGGQKVITFYGGMQTSGVNYFKDDATYDNTISYGNFVLAYESDFEWEMPEDDNSNFAVLKVKNETTEEYTGIKSFTVNLTDKGVLSISSARLSEWVRVDVSVQKYAQLDFEKMTEEEYKQFSSEPFNKVIISATDETDPDAIIYDSSVAEIPTRIFVVGFESSYLYVQVDLKLGYNFTDAISSDYIYGDSYINRYFAGGSLVISALQENAVTLSINMVAGSGNDAKLFANSMTKICISKDGVTTVEDLEEYLSQTAKSGYATLRGIERGTNVQILIELSPYYMMEVEGTLYASRYLNFEYTMTENKTITVKVSEISFEVPVTYGDQTIGTLKIYFERVENIVSNNGISVSATYQARFKAVDEDAFGFISLTHPNKYGFKLVNLQVVCDGQTVNLLKVFSDGYFGIDSTDYSLHSFLATTVFNIPDNNLTVEAVFTSKLIDFYFDYNSTRYVGKTYYGESEIYMQNLVQVVERGMYFGGITAKIGSDEFIFQALEAGAVLVEDGEFAGMYKYDIMSVFNIDDASATYEIILSYSTYKVTFVFTTDTENYSNLERDVKYNSEFSIEQLNTDNLPRPFYATGYNLIGWNLAEDDSVNYVILTDDNLDADFTYYNTFTYEWIENVRFVPVFAPGVAVVTIYDTSGNFMNSIKIHYDDEVLQTLGGLISDGNGNYYKNEKFGYDFLGFFDAMTAGNLVLSYNEDPEGYSINEELTQYFKNEDNVIRWALEENLDLYGRFDAVNYSLDLTFTNFTDCHGTKQVATNTGTVTTVGTGAFYISNFFITDTLVLSGLNPLSTAYISKITVGVKNFEGEDEPVMREVSFYAVCDRAGNVTITNVDSLFNESRYELTLVVADFINEESGADTIVVNIEYLPITYIVSFTASLVTSDGTMILSDKSETYYYKLTASTAYIGQVNNWERCDEEGKVYAGKGWWNLTTPSTRLTFTSQSLNGIAGLRFTAPNGKVYSFKGWKDVTQDVEIGDLSKLNGAYDFVSVFSDEYDVTVNYLIYNDISKDYTMHYTTGYFWSYNSTTKNYYIDNAIVANAYEIYLIGGNLYYIAGWTDSEVSGFTTLDDVNSYITMNDSLSLTYNKEPYQLELFALYNRFDFSVSETTNSYVAEVNLPNDPSGNSYDDSDVIWLAVDKSDFDTLSSTNYSDADKITNIYRYSEGMASYKIGSGKEFSKSQTVAEDKYLFAVVVRKINDVDYQIAYVAVRVI